MQCWNSVINGFETFVEHTSKLRSIVYPKALVVQHMWRVVGPRARRTTSRDCMWPMHDRTTSTKANWTAQPTLIGPSMSCLCCGSDCGCPKWLVRSDVYVALPPQDLKSGTPYISTRVPIAF